MKRLRAWLVRRLATPRIGERRRMAGTEWVCVQMTLDRSLNRQDLLTVTYQPRAVVEAPDLIGFTAVGDLDNYWEAVNGADSAQGREGDAGGVDDHPARPGGA